MLGFLFVSAWFTAPDPGSTDARVCAYQYNLVMRDSAARAHRLVSEGGEIMKLHIEGSLTIRKPIIKRV